MEISRNIIIGETISHNSAKILRGIRHPFLWKKGLWFGITTSLTGDNLLYILSGREMRLKFYKNGNLKVLGLAGSMREAYEIVRTLVQSGYDEGQIFNMKEYLDNY